MIKYLLDTNICIYLIKGASAKTQKHFEKFDIGDLGISVITLLELQYGISNSHHLQQNQLALNRFLTPLEVLDYPSSCAPLYAEIRSQLKKKGKNIGPLDLLIGVHALFFNLTLVTNNIREFKRISGLNVENWTL